MTNVKERSVISKKNRQDINKVQIMATKKAGGSSRNGRDSAGRRLGVKNMEAKQFFQEI